MDIGHWELPRFLPYMAAFLAKMRSLRLSIEKLRQIPRDWIYPNINAMYYNDQVGSAPYGFFTDLDLPIRWG